MAFETLSWQSLSNRDRAGNFLSLYDGPYANLIEVNTAEVNRRFASALEVNKLILFWQDFQRDSLKDRLRLVQYSVFSGGSNFYIRDREACRMVVMFDNPIFTRNKTTQDWLRVVNGALISALSPYSINLLRSTNLTGQAGLIRASNEREAELPTLVRMKPTAS